MLRYVGLALLGYRILVEAKDQVAKNLIYSFDNVTPNDFTLLGGVLTLRFRLLNNNAINLRIKSITGTLSHNGNLLAPVNTPARITLLAGAEKALRLEIKLDNKSVIEHLTQLLTNGGIFKPLIFKGAVNVNGIRAKFTKEIHFLR